LQDLLVEETKESAKAARSRLETDMKAANANVESEDTREVIESRMESGKEVHAVPCDTHSVWSHRRRSAVCLSEPFAITPHHPNPLFLLSCIAGDGGGASLSQDGRR